MFNLLPITTCSFLSAKPQKYSQEYIGAEFAESRKARYVPPSPAQFPVSSSSPWWVWTCIPDKCTHAQKYTSNAQISDHTDRENIGFQSLIILTHIVSALFLLIDLLYIMKGHYQVPLKPSCLKDEQLQLSQSVLRREVFHPLECLSCTEDSMTGYITPGEVSLAHSRGIGSPSSTCWPHLLCCSRDLLQLYQFCKKQTFLFHFWLLVFTL